jgi:hypothetical protein
MPTTHPPLPCSDDTLRTNTGNRPFFPMDKLAAFFEGAPSDDPLHTPPHDTLDDCLGSDGKISTATINQ